MTTEIVPREPTALVPSDLPAPVFRGAQMVQAIIAYRELQKALDEAMPDQLIELEGKQFRKKGYWRAISVAFNLTVVPTEPSDERRNIICLFEDGRENFGYSVTYRATTVGGRSVTGDGACFAAEKARRFRCPHPESPGSKRTVHYPQESCPDYDPNFQWKTLPGQATEHNIRAHAHTRAANRAISNLVGFGEVSAEEVERDEPEANATTVPVRADGSALVAGVETKTGEGARGSWTMYLVRFDDGREGSTFNAGLAAGAVDAQKDGALVLPTFEQKGKYVNLTGLSLMGLGGGTPTDDAPAVDTHTVVINPNQVKRFHAIATVHGWTDAERHELEQANGYGSSKEITVADYERLVDILKSRQLAAQQK